MAIPGPYNLPKIFLCLNSGQVGTYPIDVIGGSLHVETNSTMIGQRPLNPELHPFIRDWYGPNVDPSTAAPNIDPYRQVMSYNYSYVSVAGSSNDIVVNSYGMTRTDPSGFASPSGSLAVVPYFDRSNDIGGWTGLPDPSKALTPRTQPLSEQTLVLEFNTNGWNIMQAWGGASQKYYNFLRQENINEVDEGIPYFDRYLMGSLDASEPDSLRLQQAGLVGTYDGLFKYNVLFSGDRLGPPPTPRWYYDHSFIHLPAIEWRLDPRDNSIVEIDALFTVDSTYNFYIESSPQDYEEIIAPTRIPECILPNYYMVQHCYASLAGASPALASVVASATTISRIGAPEIGLGPDPRLHGELPYLPQVTAGSEEQHYVDIFRQTPWSPPSTGEDPDPLRAQRISRGYWRAFATTLSTITDGDINAFVSKYKNIVVAYDDLNFLNDRNGDNSGRAIESYPFYNKIVINDRPLGSSHNWVDQLVGSPMSFAGALAPSITEGLMNQHRTWVTMLQLLVANSYNSALPDPSRATTTDPNTMLGGLVQEHTDWFYTPNYRRSINLDLNWIGDSLNEEGLSGYAEALSSERNQSFKVRAEVDSLALPSEYRGPYVGIPATPNYMNGTWLTSLDHSYYRQLYETLGETDGPSAPIINYSILRDPEKDLNYLEVLASDQLNIEESVRQATKTISEKFRGVASKSAPLMYVIEKRIVTPGAESANMADEPVQRIFITRKFGLSTDPVTDITYYDTQVKYGVRYQYDVKMLTILFGTQYQYDNVEATHETYDYDVFSTADRPGRALGNALGFYEEENPDHGTLGSILKHPNTQYNYLTQPGFFSTIGPYFKDTNYGLFGLDPDNWNNRTDIGRDGTVVASWSGIKASQLMYAQTGYYIFARSGGGYGGGAGSIDPNSSMAVDWLAYGWVNQFAASLRRDWRLSFRPPSSQEPWLRSNLVQGAPPGSSFGAGVTLGAATPGGMYSTGIQEAILERLHVEVKTGNRTGPVTYPGMDGNETGGLFAISAEVGPGGAYAPGPMPAGTCFVAGTKITVTIDGKLCPINIEEIQVDDLVASYNLLSRQVEIKPVISTRSPIHDDIVEFLFSNGTKTQHTHDHPYYVENKGWASYAPEKTRSVYKNPDLENTSLIEVGDLCMLITGEPVILEAITEVFSGPTQTYNIVVKDNNNYFADGILVHNKVIAGPTGGPGGPEDAPPGGPTEGPNGEGPPEEEEPPIIEGEDPENGEGI